jgi:pimeloyl-ACP methyl ester carboxylesterase
MTKSGLTYHARGKGPHTVVFVHGFLDAGKVWDEAIAASRTNNVEWVQLDLAGMGERFGDAGPFSLERFAADVGDVVDALDKPVVLVGQSMGAQVAELVAARKPSRTAGLVLVTPVPLGGLQLPTEATASFSSLGADAKAQLAARTQLTAGLGDAALQRLTDLGLRVRSDVVPELVNTWNTGHPHGAQASGYGGPVLIVNGARDGFITDELIAATVAPRYGNVARGAVADAGHWPHFEQAQAFSALLDEFLARLTWPATAAGSVGSPASNTSESVRQQGWTQAFAEKSSTAFAETFDPEVVLEASVLAEPIQGLVHVKAVMAAASKVYESLTFTHEARNGPRNYLEWKAAAFGGQHLYGVTVLTKDDAGKIVHVAIHHRPLLAALRFSDELRERLAGQVDARHFHQPNP